MRYESLRIRELVILSRRNRGGGGWVGAVEDGEGPPARSRLTRSILSEIERSFAADRCGPPITDHQQATASQNATSPATPRPAPARTAACCGRSRSRATS